jgi:hypothetical protein
MPIVLLANLAGYLAPGHHVFFHHVTREEQISISRLVWGLRKEIYLCH